MQCLDHLARQTVRPRKVVIVDNASTDGAIDALAPELANGISIVRMGHNAGFAAANNRGFEEIGDCEWVALLNPDAFPAEDWLEKLLAAARHNPAFQFFACRQLMAQDPERLDGAGDAYHVSGAHWRRGYGAGRATQDRPLEVFSACGAAALYRADVLREVGGFDEQFFCYAEDVDLGFRLRLRGYRCLYVPEAVVHHVGSASTGRGSDFVVYYGHRNLVWVFVKNMPGALLWRYLPQHLLFNLVSMAWFTARGQGRAILRAKIDALKGIRAILAKRENIQKNKMISNLVLRQFLCRHVFAPYLRGNSDC